MYKTGCWFLFVKSVNLSVFTFSNNKNYFCMPLFITNLIYSIPWTRSLKNQFIHSLIFQNFNFLPVSFVRVLTNSILVYISCASILVFILLKSNDITCFNFPFKSNSGPLVVHCIIQSSFSRIRISNMFDFPCDIIKEILSSVS